MTIVFVHGVPNTAAVWDPLRSMLSGPRDRRSAIARLWLRCARRLQRDSLCLPRLANRLNWRLSRLRLSRSISSVTTRARLSARASSSLGPIWSTPGCSAEACVRRTSSGTGRPASGRTPDWASVGAMTFFDLDLDTRAGMLSDRWRSPRSTLLVSRPEWTAGCSTTYCRCIGPRRIWRTGRLIRPPRTRRVSCCGAGTDPYQAAEFGRAAAAASGAPLPRTRVRALVAD